MERRKQEGVARRTQTTADQRERPDGFTLIALGWIGIGFGIFLSIIVVAQATTPGGRDFVDGPAGFLISWIAGCLIEFGLMLLLTGLVIRAIWLIPAREPAAPEGNGSELSA